MGGKFRLNIVLTNLLINRVGLIVTISPVFGTVIWKPKSNGSLA
jgi:hypothetical protein